MSFFIRPRGVKIPYGLAKPLLIMKLTFGLILLMHLNLIANVSSQTKITLNLRSVEFKDVLSIIEKQSDYRFMFSNRNIPAKEKLDINVKDAQISTVMDMILSNSPFTYQELANNLIVIIPKGEKLNAIRITGKVLDQTGEVLIGASIKIKGTSEGVATDENGSFTMSVPDDAILVISYVGFKTQEIPVSGKTSLTITLQPNEKVMNEVVVTALGIKREQKALGYAVSTITSDQITAAGATNFASALYGKAAGVKITTAPGGATSAVNVQIRGINSLNYNTQPLYVVDGIQIRNNNETGGKGGNSTTNYYDDTRIRGNGILDINPADIESLTVLKGASATALYGSDASSGVVVITTKKGTRGRGLGVDVNYYLTSERVTSTPHYQNIYGPGYDRATNLASYGITDPDGWIAVDAQTVRPNFRAWAQFGPKMDGRLVPWWDGTMHPYSPQPDNYKNMFQKGFSSNLNVSLSNATDKADYRFSYTRKDYKGIQIGGMQGVNTFNLNSSVRLHPKLSVDLVGNYVNTDIKNRPMLMGRIFNAFDGFFSRAEDMAVDFDKYKTTEGYEWVPYDQAQRNPDEAVKYNIRPELMNFLWNQLRNTYSEEQDRFLSSVTLNYDIAKGLKFRSRIGNDFTSLNNEERDYNTVPIAFNGTSSTGAYIVTKGRYNITYSDLLLSYSSDLAKKFVYEFRAGYQARKEAYSDQKSSTNGGLVTANWFSLNNSYNPQSTGEVRSGLLKDALLGVMNLSYGNYAFLEATIRRERTSTLPNANNTYVYPSVNGSFVMSDVFHMPRAISYAKLRASFGLVGNAPPPYTSNVTYVQKPISTTGGSVPVLVAQNNYGNANLESEKKTEMEGGLEMKFLNNVIGFDLSYYDSRVTNLLMNLSTPPSSGAVSEITNVGELHSHGVELAINATPVSRKVRWTTTLTAASNTSSVVSLTPGVERIVFGGAQIAGSLIVTAEKNQPIGNIYIYPVATDGKGNRLVNSLGEWYNDPTKYQKVGNVLPKVVGGWANTVSYRQFVLTTMIDYRFGGSLASPPLQYAYGAGMYTNTMQYRDAAHGGKTYTLDNSGNMIPGGTPGQAGVHEDGVIVKGVLADGTPNTKMIQAANYYRDIFGAADATSVNLEAVQKNSYIKFRELTLGYNFSKATTQKLRMQNLRVSLVGRNLFFLYRTLKNLDPEAPTGQAWYQQGIDLGSSAATRSLGVSLNCTF
jgi:iron complex outermembrane recepter protein